MSYKLEFDRQAVKQLKKMDKAISKMVLGWLYKNVHNTDNPRQQGKALTGDKKGLWRYRIGNYRAICYIEDSKLPILTLQIGHRRDIYK